MRRCLLCLLLLAGCAAPPTRHEEKAPPPPVAPAHPFRTLIIYIPQTDDNAASWLKWFTKTPNLRMVIAMSPRFTHLAKDPVLRSKFLALRKEGRLEIAMQLANAPILPLVVESPPYGYPDDVVQLIAQAKAGFFKTWNFLPQGLVLPYGAASPKLITIFERLGFAWLAGALNQPPVDGPYQSGSLMVWDGLPSGKPLGTAVRVWDERQMKEHPLDSWILETKNKEGQLALPQDPGYVPVPINTRKPWPPKTWEGSDWSLWVGSPAKDAAWTALRRTREDLEKYKNSGQASVQRLDVAFEELFSAQSANYFSVIGSTTASPGLVEEREHEFQASLVAIYRMINQPPPDNLFATNAAAPVAGPHTSSTTARAESFPDGRQHVVIMDATGDAIVPSGTDLKSLDVWASSDTVRWAVTLSTVPPSAVEIYVDFNAQPNIGTPTFLPGRPYAPSPRDAWEFAIAIASGTATLYRTEGTGTFGVVQTFPVVADGNRLMVSFPRDLMRGNPKRWGYQVLVVNNQLSDFIDPLEISQKDLLQDLSTSKRNDIPFVRIK